MSCKDLQQRFHDALTGLVPDPAPYAAMVKPAQDARFGDYQANCAMSLGKVLGKPPRAVAQTLVERLRLDDLLEPPEIAGPGFINLRLRTDWLARQVRAMAADDRLGVAPASPPKTFVIDYSSPNVAKPMHVGHLRSTIIGDALARLLRFLGHNVVTDNHLGDWGTQFGILLYGYKNLRDEAAFQADPVRELARLYVEVRNRFQEGRRGGRRRPGRPGQGGVPSGDGEAARRRPGERAAVEDVHARRAWKRSTASTGGWTCISTTRSARASTTRCCRAWCKTSGEGHRAGKRGGGHHPAGRERRAVADPQAGRRLHLHHHRPGHDPYRLKEWHPDAILYVVDFRQKEHFANLFDAAQRWGCSAELEHVSFGAVLGKDGKPLKTREGGVPELNDLLDDAVRRAGQVYEAARQEAIARGEEVPELSRRNAPDDLRSGRPRRGEVRRPVAEPDQRLQIRSRQDDGDGRQHRDVHAVRLRPQPQHLPQGRRRSGGAAATSRRPLLLETPEERALASQLVRFEEALTVAAADYKPSFVTAYLWDLAKTYSGFFQNCPVLKAETPALRQSRLLLCDLTARVIQRGLDLLGIRTVERM